MSDKPRQPLPPLKPGEQAIEQWLRGEVVPAYQHLKADPASGMSVADMRAALAKRRQKSS